MNNKALKKKPFIAVLIILVALISGLIMAYTTGTPKVFTTEEIIKIFDDNNLSYTDATANAQDEMLKSGLADCIIAEQDDMKIEFYNFEKPDAALRVYREAYRMIITEYMSVPRIQVKGGKLNYKFYTLDTNGRYTVTIYVKNTAVYAYCDSENKHILNGILVDMGYLQVKK